ncbi:lasso peptide biosynthesis PqqD family chaperone [Neobacillus sp. MM2021_6]|uniref:lasso peptide biosynthesis PqqD family chaperone n=1 Tax=Bacillaceae TaxID=186817 RepID=UPI00140A1AF7|nr:MULTISPECIES: lasso peptide biosynthesis PqqD family chaperone [Bacillaceae]MBO0958863.1 lasso peptide biosynthesis PqqD family chaperone [Neobacillus sp. MM2021_6]NHC17592.1 lasso peptide biosynthesis PqqD family chaperone [Bacillus sp. MM2020_4]
MIKSKISLNDSVVQIKGNIVSDMGGEKVMLSVNKGKYYNLGEIGGDIWDLIGEEMAVKQLLETLMSNYDVKLSECEDHVISFLELLLDEGLIEILDRSL